MSSASLQPATIEAARLRERLERYWSQRSPRSADDPLVVAALERLEREIRLLLDAGHGWAIRELPRFGDPGNYLSYCLEIHFAAGLLASGMPLRHAVRRLPENDSDLDFRFEDDAGLACNFELICVQEYQKTAWQTAELAPGITAFGAVWDEKNEAAEVVRIQRKLRAKTIAADGSPRKFPPPAENEFNILVADVSGMGLAGNPDFWDCQHVAWGQEPTAPIPEWLRLPVLGLFEWRNRLGPECGAEFEANRFLRERIHVILFLTDASRWGSALGGRYGATVVVNWPLLPRPQWDARLAPLLEPAFRGWVKGWVLEPRIVDRALDKLAEAAREAGLMEEDLASDAQA